MIHSADWYIIFVFFCSLLGLAVSGVLFFANRNESFQARLLAGFLTSLSLVGLNNALMATQVYTTMPHLWRAIAFTSFLPAPFSYLYVRSVLEQSYRFRRNDFWFFVPAILYVITMLPFYLQPAAVKLDLIHRIIQNNDLIAQEPENMLPGGMSTLARTIYGIGTSAAMAWLLYRWKRRIEADKQHANHNLPLYRWLVLFTLVASVFFAIIFFVIISHLTRILHIWDLVAFTISLTVLFICLSLLTRPAILYGLQGWLQPEPVAPDAAVELEKPVARKTSLSQSQGMEIQEAITNLFTQKQPFLTQHYKLADLSTETGLPAYLLSAFINQQYGKNFNEFINDFRVEYLEGLLKSQKDQYAHYTLEALGKMAGFNSRNAFIASVKRKTGLTPSEFFGLKEA